MFDEYTSYVALVCGPNSERVRDRVPVCLEEEIQFSYNIGFNLWVLNKGLVAGLGDDCRRVNVIDIGAWSESAMCPI